MNALAKTGFFVSVISYVFFLFADYARPGFVSSVFSVHVFLIPVIVFGIWFALSERDVANVSKLSIVSGVLIRCLLSVMLATIFWTEGEVFGDFRLVLAIVVFLLPWVNTKSLYE